MASDTGQHRQQKHSGGTDMPTCLGAIRLLCDVARLCNDPAPVRDIAGRVLSRVCVFNGWYAGRVHAIDSSGEMRSVAVEVAAATPDSARAELDRMDDLLRDQVVRSSEPVWQRTEFVTDGARAVTGVGAPIRTNGTIVGVIILLGESRPPPTEELRSAVETVATLLAGVIERQLLDRTIAEVSTEEQHRIGRDLHDSISQDLSGAALIGDGVERRLERASHDDADAVRQITRSIRNALAAIRGITEGLIPLHLDDGGLGAAVERMAEHTDRRSETMVSIEGHAPNLPATVSRELFLITSEAVRNAMTHAAASAIEIKWATDKHADEPAVTLEIIDDGRGLPPESGYDAGRGIAIMRHRASVIDGTFEIDTSASGGTTIRCRVPISHRDRHDDRQNDQSGVQDEEEAR